MSKKDYQTSTVDGAAGFDRAHNTNYEDKNPDGIYEHKIDPEKLVKVYKLILYKPEIVGYFKTEEEADLEADRLCRIRSLKGWRVEEEEMEYELAKELIEK